MIRIHDTYVSLSNIKKIYYNRIADNSYMYIEYQFDDQPVRLEVGSFDEYIMFADEIVEALK